MREKKIGPDLAENWVWGVFGVADSIFELYERIHTWGTELWDNSHIMRENTFCPRLWWKFISRCIVGRRIHVWNIWDILTTYEIIISCEIKMLFRQFPEKNGRIDSLIVSMRQFSHEVVSYERILIWEKTKWAPILLKIGIIRFSRSRVPFFRFMTKFTLEVVRVMRQYSHEIKTCFGPNEHFAESE